MNPEIEMGPLVSQEHMEKVLTYIEIGKARRCPRCMRRQTNTGVDWKRDGFFIEPTVFSQCKT